MVEYSDYESKEHLDYCPRCGSNDFVWSGDAFASSRDEFCEKYYCYECGLIIYMEYEWVGMTWEEPKDDDWVGKYDYLKEQGIDVIYFPYGEGISSSSLKKRIYNNYKKLQDKANSHLPIDAITENK